MAFISRFLPRKAVSYLIGKILHWQGPNWWAQMSIGIFSWWYHINLNEAELPLSQYSSIGDFFTRRLKAGVRPIATKTLVHPADSEIVQYGPIDGDSLIQAKGKLYPILRFTEDPEWQLKWSGGFFITYYLCPTDYHRVHSPVDGFITHVTYVNGDLWPVNQWALNQIHDLYGENERILIEIATDLGPVAVVLVGALNVGYMTLAFDPRIRGNHGLKSQRKKLDIPVEIKKGDELGMFRMGSTVVVLYPPEVRSKHSPLQTPQFVKVGQGATID